MKNSRHIWLVAPDLTYSQIEEKIAESEWAMYQFEMEKEQYKLLQKQLKKPMEGREDQPVAPVLATMGISPTPVVMERRSK